MGAEVSRTDYEWVYTEEPHVTCRKEILKKYPQIKKLMGYDSTFKYIVTLMVVIQILACFFIKDASWPNVIIAAYCFDGVINHSLSLAIHEIAHNLAFGHSQLLANCVFGIFANLSTGVSMFITFKKYHLEHNRYQGLDTIDMDMPSRLEAKLCHTTFTKFLWVVLQAFFYALRPVFFRPLPVTQLEIINTSIQVIFDLVVLDVLDVKALIYLIAGSLLAMGLHPVAGHFISEHYMFKKGFETYSYYGPLNWITFNVGYHNEHHDFPNVPGSRLPQIKKIAPEYYDNLPQHHSWVKVWYDFVMDPEIGSYARIKCKGKINVEEEKD